MFTAWAMSHQTRVAGDVTWDPAAPREAYSDPNVYTKVQEYTLAVQQRHGPEYDVRTEPIDAEAIMRLGGGRKHGRTWIANAAIDPTTVPTLSQLRAQSTSSSQPIRSRPTPTLQRVDALEAQNNEKTAQITALTARLEAEQAAREAQEVRIAEMMQIMQALGQKTGVPVQMSAPPPQVPHAFAATPPQSAGSNNPPRASPDSGGFVTPPSTQRPDGWEGW
ncbi:uncharacterized protein [Miscanthus floridulus]|uniref:uncharacterized protein n=2 Tax=Miscanthus floridulus TaxID=154761 RepID=UPI00345B0D27